MAHRKSKGLSFTSRHLVATWVTVVTMTILSFVWQVVAVVFVGQSNGVLGEPMMFFLLPAAVLLGGMVLVPVALFPVAAGSELICRHVLRLHYLFQIPVGMVLGLAYAYLGCLIYFMIKGEGQAVSLAGAWALTIGMTLAGPLALYWGVLRTSGRMMYLGRRFRSRIVGGSSPAAGAM